MEIGTRHTADDGWFNGRGYANIARDQLKNYESLTFHILYCEQDHYFHIVYNHTRMNWLALPPRRKVCFICESKHLKAQYPDAPWNCESKQTTARRFRATKINVEQMNNK